MNKTVLRIIIILVSGLILLFIIFRSRSPFGSDNSTFSTDPKDEITSIEISGDKANISLEKKGSDWFLNGSTESRKSAVQFIIKILHEVSIKSPVSEQLFESEISSKDIKPVKVKVYSSNRLIKSFLVYKTSSNEYGNIMKMRESSKPFIVYVPGLEGDIGSAFTVNELFWLPYNLFNIMPSEISSVDFKNNNDTAASFSILRKGRRFYMKGDEANKLGWDSTLINRYISYFTWVPFESWALDMNENETKATEASKPLYRISVTTSTGRKNSLILWQKTVSTADSVYIDTDRLLGKSEAHDELLNIRYFDIDPLIKKRSYFFPE